MKNYKVTVNGKVYEVSVEEVGATVGFVAPAAPVAPVDVPAPATAAPVATVDGVEYFDLDEAFAAIREGSSVKLFKEFCLSFVVKIRNSDIYIAISKFFRKNGVIPRLDPRDTPQMRLCQLQYLAEMVAKQDNLKKVKP